MTQTISFSYPRRGLVGEFNTVRLGLKWAEKLPIGSVVDLIDSRSKKVLERAIVLSVVTGNLTDMAALHAHQAHNWKDYDPADQRPAMLIASMKKRYPPGRVFDDSKVSVIYLATDNKTLPSWVRVR